MRFVDLSGNEDYWQQLIAGEPQPFGGVAEQLSWREKTVRFGLCEDDGRLIAAAGLVVARVRAGEAEPLPVSGLGGVIVTRRERGRGLARTLIERALVLAEELGPRHAMLFCLPRNVGLYAKFGFQAVGSPVSAQQPDGPVEVPLPAMWKPLHPHARWPPGPVEVLGEPF